MTKIQIGEIVTIVIAIITGAMFIGALNSRVSYLEKELATTTTRIELENKVAQLEKNYVPKLEEQMKNLSNKLDSLEKKLSSTPIPEEESCSLIDPIFADPSSGATVSSPVMLKGIVKTIPEKSHLWIIAFNPNTKGYSDFIDIVPNEKKAWQREITLAGGKVGDIYDIDIVLVNNDKHAELVKCRQSKEFCDISQNVKSCKQITVTLKP